MRMWIDTEFNGYQGALISTALVTEGGEEWYEVLDCNETIEPWVAEHVLPFLGQPPVTRKQAQASLDKFLTRHGASGITIIGDWPCDFKYFCDLIVTGPGKRINAREFTMSLRDDLPDTADISAIPHNALADAHALRLACLQREAPGTRENPNANNLTGDAAWLWTHCRALGMTRRSDSGLLRDDVALYVAELRATQVVQNP